MENVAGEQGQLLFPYKSSKGCRILADVFVEELQTFYRSQIRLKFVLSISWSHTSRLVARSCKINMAFNPHDLTLVTFANWLRRARASTNCLGSAHTSRQGPTKRFDI